MDDRILRMDVMEISIVVPIYGPPTWSSRHYISVFIKKALVYKRFYLFFDVYYVYAVSYRTGWHQPIATPLDKGNNMFVCVSMLMR